MHFIVHHAFFFSVIQCICHKAFLDVYYVLNDVKTVQVYSSAKMILFLKAYVSRVIVFS